MRLVQQVGLVALATTVATALWVSPHVQDLEFTPAEIDVEISEDPIVLERISKQEVDELTHSYFINHDYLNSKQHPLILQNLNGQQQILTSRNKMHIKGHKYKRDEHNDYQESDEEEEEEEEEEDIEENVDYDDEKEDDEEEDEVKTYEDPEVDEEQESSGKTLLSSIFGKKAIPESSAKENKKQNKKAEGNKNLNDPDHFYNNYHDKNYNKINDNKKINVPVKKPVPDYRQLYGDPKEQPLIYEVDLEEARMQLEDIVEDGKYKLATFLATASSNKFFEFLETVMKIKEFKRVEEEKGSKNLEKLPEGYEHEDVEIDDSNEDYDETNDGSSNCIHGLEKLTNEMVPALEELSMAQIIQSGRQSHLNAVSANTNKEDEQDKEDDKVREVEFSEDMAEELKSTAQRRIKELTELLNNEDISKDSEIVKSIKEQEFKYRTGNIYLDDDFNEINAASGVRFTLSTLILGGFLIALFV